MISPLYIKERSKCMDTKKLYNEVYLKTKMGEAAFRRAFNGAVRYIISRYGVKYTTDDTESVFIAETGDESSLFDEYLPAVQSYIEHLSGNVTEHYAELTQLFDLSYRTRWRETNKNRHIRGCAF